MALEMAYAPAALEKALGLGDVVEKGGQPDFPSFSHSVQHPKGVLPHIVDMIRGVLFKPLQGLQFRHHLHSHRKEFLQHPWSSHTFHQADKFPGDALLGHLPQQMPLFHQSPGGLLLQIKIQARGKPKPPQNPQAILLKPPARLSHGPNQPLFQVLRSTKGIDQPMGWRKRHGIDGKIPPGQVLPDILCGKYPIGPPPVFVAPFPTQPGDLQGLPFHHRRHRAITQTGGNHRIGRKQLFHLLRRNGTGQIIILGIFPPQQIPQTASHQKDLEPLAFQPLHHQAHRKRQTLPLNGGAAAHSSASSPLRSKSGTYSPLADSRS